MPNSIYQQLSSGLAQAVRYGDRSILYRGKTIACAVLLGNTSTQLVPGGLQTDAVVHVKIPKASVPIGPDGEPHTNEPVTFPAAPANGLIPRPFIIQEVIPEEYAWNFTLVDPSK
jgi:hypothetical protein